MDISTISNMAVSWSSETFFMLALLALWSIFWKGLALWHAGRRAQASWFIVLLLINTAGILDIIYLLGVLKIKVSNLFSK